MPDLKCLKEEVVELKKGMALHTNQILKVSADVAKNTEITVKTKEDTEEIIELMKWGKMTRKVIFWAGSFLAGIWALAEGLKQLK